MELKTIARIRTGFATKFGLPRQSGLVPELEGEIVFEKEYRSPDALRGLADYTHLWLIWGFSAGFASANGSSGWSPTVRPPRLGGNVHMGVFATRSPNRPNPIGLSCVKILSIENESPDGPVIRVAGVDMLDDTPIYDIKPYLPHADCKSEAIGGFSADVVDYQLAVEICDDLLARLPENLHTALRSVLAQDPRPSYQNDPERVYGFPFYGYEIRFSVREKILTVLDIHSTNVKKA